MDINKVAIGKRINSIRMSSGLNMREFGEKIYNASDSLVSRWEKGYSLPANKRLVKIATFGNCSVSYLLYGTYDELIKDLINIYFENHTNLDFIDKNDITQYQIAKYDDRKNKIFNEVSSEFSDSEGNLKISVWELKNQRDQLLYDEISNGLLKYLNRINNIYSSREGKQKLEKFKYLSNLLQREFKDSEMALTNYMNKKLDKMYNEERLIYNENAHKVIKNDMNKFFIRLLKGCFQHNKYNMTQNTIDFIYDDILKDFEERSYRINFNKYEGWNDLDDDIKEKIFNQIDEMASLLIEREVRNLK